MKMTAGWLYKFVKDKNKLNYQVNLFFLVILYKETFLNFVFYGLVLKI